MSSGLLRGAVFGSVLLAALAAWQPVTAGETAEVVAKVNGESITLQEWESAFSAAARQKLYHQNPAPERVDALKQEVLDELIVGRLLDAEAQRRGIRPDEAAVDKQVAGYDEQYKGSAAWAEQRERVLPRLRAHLGEETIRKQLEAEVRRVADPTEDELVAYYKDNIPAFTEPVRNRVSAILLKVDPSSGGGIWAAAADEAWRIHAKLKAGADFAELAKLHSGDGSGANGGDLGYLHAGMLPEEVETVVAKMTPGTFSDPVRVLEGYVLILLADRTEPVVHGLDRVRERAVQLYKRARGETQWNALVEKLRAAGQIEVLMSSLPQKAPAAN